MLLQQQRCLLGGAGSYFFQNFAMLGQELNGGVPRGEQWHRQLLHDMALDVRKVRPHVVSTELAAELGEFLRFRHVFRNVYGFVLESERMRPLEERFAGVLNRLAAEIQAFGAWMLGESGPA